MILSSSVFDSCYKDDKKFSYQLDTSGGCVILMWEWIKDGYPYRYGRMVSFLEIENFRDVAEIFSVIADERNWE